MRKTLSLLLLLILFSVSFAAYRWSVQTGGPISGQPLIDGDSVLVGSYDGKIYSFSALEGRKRWEYDFGSPISARLVPFNGMVAVAGGNSVMLFDQAQKQSSWIQQIAGRVNGLAASSDSLFVSTSTGIYSFGVDGQLRWKTDYNATHTAPTLGGGMLLVGRGDEVIAISPQGGGQLWKQKLGGNVWESAPTYFENRIFAGASDGKLYMLSVSDGEVLWTFQTDGWVTTTPAFYGGLVIIGASSGSVYGISIASGSQTWKYELPEGTFGSVKTIDQGSRSIALVPSMDGKLYAFDSDPPGSQGSLLWSFATASGAGSPAVSGTNIYFGSRDSHLYALTSSPFCSINSPQDGSLVNEAEIIVRGKAYSTTALDSLQIRINEGAWSDIPIAADWEYELNPSDFAEGKIQIECRASDSLGQEQGRFSTIALVRSSDAPKPEIEVAIPERIEAGKQFEINVTGLEGRPLSDVYVTAGGKSFSGNEAGAVQITIQNSGRGTMAVNRKGYAPKYVDTFAHGSDFTPFLFIAVIAIAAGATLFFLRFRGKQRTAPLMLPKTPGKP
jgi:outer membrane protein assembly factor BamB